MIWRPRNARDLRYNRVFFGVFAALVTATAAVAAALWRGIVWKVHGDGWGDFVPYLGAYLTLPFFLAAAGVALWPLAGLIARRLAPPDDAR